MSVPISALTEPVESQPRDACSCVMIELGPLDECSRTQLPGDFPLQGSAENAPLISVIWTENASYFLQCKHKSVGAVWETLSPQQQLCSHCVSQASTFLHYCIHSSFENFFQTSSFRADGSVEAKFSEYAQQKFTPALLQCLHDRNVSLCCSGPRDAWTCTLVCNATPSLSLCWLQHSVVTVPGDHHVHLSSPQVVAPLVSNFLQTRVLRLPTSATHKLWSSLQKQLIPESWIVVGWDSWVQRF